MAALTVLERKIERHIKENADQIKSFKSELQTLKCVPRTKILRPCSELSKPKEVVKLRKPEISRKPAAKSTNLVKDAISSSMPSINTKTPKKSNLQHHPNDDEMKKEKVCSVISTSSYLTETDSVMTKINYNGNSMKINCNPLKLIQFLVSDLKMKLKDFVPDDDKDISKVLKEINYAIKQAFLEQGLSGLSTMQNLPIQNQTIEGGKAVKGNQTTSKEVDIQTDLDGDEVEKLQHFHDKYLEKQLNLDVSLRQIEDMFSVELTRSNEKIVKLNSEISLLQNEINSSEQSMQQRFDLKIEVIKGEMKFLQGVIEETRNHSLIDNMHKKLEQTNKKISDVKRKCTEATKHCLKMQFDNLLMNSASFKGNEIGHELGLIKSNVEREIAALKNAVSGDITKHHRHHKNSYASSSFASSTLIRKASIESIKSAMKWNEKMTEISFEDIKFSTIIDDGKKPDKEKRLMMKAIDNASSAHCGVTSDNASKSMLHDESFN